MQIGFSSQADKTPQEAARKNLAKSKKRGLVATGNKEGGACFLEPEESSRLVVSRLYFCGLKSYNFTATTPGEGEYEHHLDNRSLLFRRYTLLYRLSSFLLVYSVCGF